MSRASACPRGSGGIGLGKPLLRVGQVEGLLPGLELQRRLFAHATGDGPIAQERLGVDRLQRRGADCRIGPRADRGPRPGRLGPILGVGFQQPRLVLVECADQAVLRPMHFSQSAGRGAKLGWGKPKALPMPRCHASASVSHVRWQSRLASGGSNSEPLAAQSGGLQAASFHTVSGSTASPTRFSAITPSSAACTAGGQVVNSSRNSTHWPCWQSCATWAA